MEGSVECSIDGRHYGTRWIELGRDRLTFPPSPIPLPSLPTKAVFAASLSFDMRRIRAMEKKSTSKSGVAMDIIIHFTTSASPLFIMRFNDTAVRQRDAWIDAIMVFVPPSSSPSSPSVSSSSASSTASSPSSLSTIIPISNGSRAALEGCFEYIGRHGIHEGIFRLAGAKMDVLSLYTRLIIERQSVAMATSSLVAERDIHVVATVAKAILRRLPETLLTSSLYGTIINAATASSSSIDNGIIALRNAIGLLPPDNRAVLQSLASCCCILVANTSTTKMEAKNLAVVIGAAFLPTDDPSLLIGVKNSMPPFFYYIIHHYAAIFGQPSPVVVSPLDDATISSIMTAAIPAGAAGRASVPHLMPSMSFNYGSTSHGGAATTTVPSSSATISTASGNHPSLAVASTSGFSQSFAVGSGVTRRPAPTPPSDKSHRRSAPTSFTTPSILLSNNGNTSATAISPSPSPSSPSPPSLAAINTSSSPTPTIDTSNHVGVVGGGVMPLSLSSLPRRPLMTTIWPYIILIIAMITYMIMKPPANVLLYIPMVSFIVILLFGLQPITRFTYRHLQTPPSFALFRGHAPLMRREGMHHVLARLSSPPYGAVSHILFGRQPWCVVSSPTAIADLTNRNFKHVFPDRVAKPVIKHSLLLAGHQTWHELRHALSPLWTSRAIANSGYDTTMPAAIARLVAEIHRTVGSSRGVDMYQLISDHVLHEMVYHSLGIQLSDAEEIHSSIAEAKKTGTYHQPSGSSSNTNTNTNATAASTRSSGTQGTTNNNLSSPVTPVTPTPPPPPASSGASSGGPPPLSRSKSRALPALPRHPLAVGIAATAEMIAPLGTLDTLLKTIPHSLLYPLLCIPSVRRALQRWRHHHHNIEQCISRAWRQHQAGETQPFKDVLSGMLAARYPRADYVTQKLLTEQFEEFFMGAYDTVSTTIAMAIYHIAVDASLCSRVTSEIDMATRGTSGDGIIQYSDLPRFPLMSAIIDETLRLYPPGQVFRYASEDTKLDGIRIPAGTYVHASLWALHRNPTYWPHPLVFNPSRFIHRYNGTRSSSASSLPHDHDMDDDHHGPGHNHCASSSHSNGNNGNDDEYIIRSGTYLPFGAGPRMCLGNQWALRTMKLTLIGLYTHFTFTLAPQQSVPVKFRQSLALVPDNGMHVIATPRVSFTL